MTPPLHLVWFKRDLRVRDHAPLVAAASAGRVLAVYVYEPELLEARDADGRHLTFLADCLRELDAALRARGSALVTRVGRLPDMFATLHAEHPIAAIHAHEETGNALSYARDRRVRAWAREQGVRVLETPSNGVVRRLPSRDGWAAQWQARMEQTPLAAPARIVGAADVASDGILDAAALRARGVRVGDDETCERLPGGERAGRAMLKSFLFERGRDYRRTMASPLVAPDTCSRISAHLACGTLSIRQAVHGAQYRARQLHEAAADGAPRDRVWLQSLESFVSRLHWHCHFIQKLEDEPTIEWQNVCRAYDGLRDETPDAERLSAFVEGRTGYPFVDACLRSLAATGWLPFRLRAMLISFAAHHLWLHWRAPGLVLARWFTDYEPGIHYSQCQMQSGTTGINTFRIYNPYLQHERFDATGAFVRRWVPELAALPDAALVRPQDTPPLEQQMAGCVIGRDYPLPIVDHATAYRHAQTALFARRAEPATRAAARAVYEKHGSRAQPLATRPL
jgi:deoxyribodipyrimidine photo-lyase